MKTFIFGALMLLVSANAWAEDYKYLKVTTSTTEESVDLATVHKITFTADNIILHTTKGEISFPLSETQRMTFTNTPSSIGSLPLQAEELQYVGGRLVVRKRGLLRIYNASGVLVEVARIESDQAEVSLDKLTPGMYIVGIGDKAIKISK